LPDKRQRLQGRIYIDLFKQWLLSHRP
jgi:hypothetical protein